MRQSSTQSIDEERSKQAKAKSDLSKLFLRFSKGEDCLQGFAGIWTFYRADSADDSDINSSFRCLRTYEAIGNDPVSIYFRTFNEHEPPNRKATMREQDGLFESGHSRPANDPFFSETMVLSEAERREGLPECTFWRCAAIDPQDVIRIAPRLPPNFMSSAADAHLRYPGWSPQSIAMGVFAFECFIEDGPRRWSMGALYSVHSSRLLSHFCILERAVEVQPTDKIDFEKLPFVQARERLDPQANMWLEGGRFKGEMEEIVWDEDGDQMRLPTRPATWSAPPKNSSTHRLFLYKDSMYAYYPLQLPAVADDLPNTFDIGARFEMGGVCGDDRTFRRLILRYSPAGHISSLTRELYKAEGSFEFERRISISMRRSHSTHPSPQNSSRRLNARVANLEKAMTAGEEASAS